MLGRLRCSDSRLWIYGTRLRLSPCPSPVTFALRLHGDRSLGLTGQHCLYITSPPAQPGHRTHYYSIKQITNTILLNDTRKVIERPAVLRRRKNKNDRRELFLDYLRQFWDVTTGISHDLSRAIPPPPFFRLVNPRKCRRMHSNILFLSSYDNVLQGACTRQWKLILSLSLSVRMSCHESITSKTNA